MQIQEAAQLSGLSADAIRFYERRGVLPRPPRQPNGYREYTSDHVAILRLARGLRELGLSLAEIALILPVAHEGTCGELRGRLSERLSETLGEIDVRMRELGQTRERLTEVLEGLHRMRPADRRVPGMTACACVQLIAGRRRRSIVLRARPGGR